MIPKMKIVIRKNDLANRDPKGDTKCDLDISKLSQDAIVCETNEPNNKK